MLYAHANGNSMVSSAKRFIRASGDVGMSFMYAINKMCDRHDPCGTPTSVSQYVVVGSSSTCTA